MSITAQYPTGEITALYLAIRVITSAEQRPAVGFCSISYADEPLAWAREDYVQPEQHFDRNGNELQRHEWIYASTIFTPAPYTRSMKITIRCWDDPRSYTRLSIIAVDEHEHVVERLMQEDIAHVIDTDIQTSAGQQPQISLDRDGTNVYADKQDPVTGRRFWWTSLEFGASNAIAYPVGRRAPEENRKLEVERQCKVNQEEWGRVEEGREERLELHDGLDLVEVEMDVEEGMVEVKTETKVKVEETETETKVKTEVMEVEETE